MELLTMIGVVVLLVVLANWVTTKMVELLSRYYFKSEMSGTRKGWFGLLGAVVIYSVILLLPAIPFIFSLKLAGIVNIGAQVTKLNKYYYPGKGKSLWKRSTRK
ncbi:Uncharacterised protein [Buttiauxella agrestis]|uniref:Uncharacterized protein n=1 Tax=Buttiauxella agrestis TaxID=82977 RepID=A0A381KN12_9ENTR|nr:hypothetical protein [Buttiauxella agrestis]SUY92764.1 Uncharacterised protein [Buttiauxella agrestis]